MRLREGDAISPTRPPAPASAFCPITDLQYMQISDRFTHYVNHFCLLEQIISWLPLAELGAETIWFPCVYFTLASVKVVQSDFTGRHHRPAGLKSPISETVCPSVHLCALYHRIQQGTSFSCSIAPILVRLYSALLRSHAVAFYPLFSLDKLAIY